MGRFDFRQRTITSEALGQESRRGVGGKSAAIDQQIGLSGLTGARSPRESDDRNAAPNSELEAALGTLLKNTPAIADADEAHGGFGLLELGQLEQHAQLGGAISRRVIRGPRGIFDNGDRRGGQGNGVSDGQQESSGQNEATHTPQESTRGAMARRKPYRNDEVFSSYRCGYKKTPARFTRRRFEGFREVRSKAAVCARCR